MNYDKNKIPKNYCNDCKVKFPNSFELVEHYLDDNEEEFDPYLILPNDYRLHLGSLLRFFYDSADNAEQIKLVTQTTYLSLYAADQGYDILDEIVQEVVVTSEMTDFDSSLKKLLDEENPNEESGE